MDKSTPSFSVRSGHDFGERLVWRYPARQPQIRRQLLAAVAAAGITELPAQITVGYYRQLPNPPGAWAFMPVNTPLAIAALGVDMVQMRICEDLATRVAKPNH